jgi:flagellar biosynthesis/type III secretory pathway chaperone
MSKQVNELETLLDQLIGEHRKLLSAFELHQAAMTRLDLKAMDEVATTQESTRRRIASLEKCRRALVVQIAAQTRTQGEMTVTKVAALFPPRAQALLKRRDELKSLMLAARARSQVVGRVAHSVLGHVNTALRLFASAMGKAGTYSKTGMPKVAARIGVMDAVG